MIGAGIGCFIGKFNSKFRNSKSNFEVFVPNMSQTVFTVLCHVGACLNGISGIIFCATPPLVSAKWFPPNERVTATSIGQMLNGLGNGVSFLIARFMVPTSESSDLQVLRQEIYNYLIFLAIPPVIFFLCVLVYFPSSPPTPPSFSASQERIPLKAGLKQLLLLPSAWFLVLVTSISQSIPGTWSAMMVDNLSKIQVNGQTLSEQWIDVLALVSSFSCTVIAILTARMTDTLRGHMKISILVLLSLATIVFTALSLVSLKVK